MRDLDASPGSQILDRLLRLRQTDAEDLAIKLDRADLVAAAQQTADLGQPDEPVGQRNRAVLLEPARGAQFFRHDDLTGTEVATHGRLTAAILQRPAARGTFE